MIGRRWRPALPALVLWSAAVVTLGMAAYPPWIQEFKDDDLHLGPTAGGYGWIFSKPGPPPWTASLRPHAVADGDFWSNRLDIIRLIVQWVGLWVLAGVSFYSLREKSSKGSPAIPPKTTPRGRTPGCEAARQKLRLPLMYDEQKIDRLVAMERERSPGATDEQHHIDAYERWTRANR